MEQYRDTLEGAAASFIMRKTNDHDIDQADVFAVIDWAMPAEINDAYFAKMIKAKIVRAPDVTRQRNRARQQNRLAEIIGSNPDTPHAFVSAWAAKAKITVDWKGSMQVGGQWTTLEDLKRVMRMKSVELDLGYERGDVDDATVQYYTECMAARPVMMDDRLSKRQAFDWDALASFFKSDERMSKALVIAILKKFVHSARRKLAGKKVTWHLMPVIHGPQGCGKTYLLEKMLAPITEAVAWSNFEQITDDRNIALWNSLVIVLDEMARAAKADSETIKHVITSETLDRRPMRSNATVVVPNRATMIGASNHRLDELIKDDTGNRRFGELIYVAPEDRTLADRLDFTAMWASVQPDDADPLEAFRDQLAALQKEYIVYGPVHDWLLNFDPNDLVKTEEDGLYKTEDLYAAFSSYRNRVTPTIDYQARAQNAFASELRRVTDQAPELGILKVHTRVGNRWKVDPRLTTPRDDEEEGRFKGNPRVSHLVSVTGGR